LPLLSRRGAASGAPAATGPAPTARQPRGRSGCAARPAPPALRARLLGRPDAPAPASPETAAYGTCGFDRPCRAEKESGGPGAECRRASVAGLTRQSQCVARREREGRVWAKAPALHFAQAVLAPSGTPPTTGSASRTGSGRAATRAFAP